MQYQVVVEFDAESGHYTATVPGLPSIVVDAKTERSALNLAKGAIAFALEEAHGSKGRGKGSNPTLRAKVVTVTI